MRGGGGDAGVLGARAELRLQHMADAVLTVTGLPPGDPLRRILPDPARCYFCAFLVALCQLAKNSLGFRV